MSNSVKTGVFFCKHLNGHPGSIQLNELYAFAEGMEEVAHIWKTGDLDLLNHQNLASVISAQGITRIVLAGEKPGFIQPMFSKALLMAALLYLTPTFAILISLSAIFLHSAIS